MPVIMLDHTSWAQLEQVQNQVNNKVRYQTDRDRLGVQEFWEPADTTGDCKDIALAKRNRLLVMGWPPEALRMATVVDEKGDLHAVLTVDVATAKGGQATYVLDNRFAEVEPWQVLTQYGYSWVERARPGHANWAYLGRSTTVRISVSPASAGPDDQG